MNVSAISCTSLKPSQSSFKSRHYDENSEYSPKPSTGTIAKRLIIAGSVAAAGTIATKRISSKLLSKINTDVKFANKIAEKTAEAFKFASTKVNEFTTENKALNKVKDIALTVLEKTEKFATKGLKDVDVASDADKALNGIKKGLSYTASGAAGLEAFKNADGDDKLNGEEVANAGMKIVEALVTGS